MLSVSLDAKATGEQKTWKERRDAVLDGIWGEHPDVIGLQEANQAIAFRSQLVDGTNQYRDIENGLNKRGANYQVTNDWANNCVKADYSSNCTYQYRGASGDNRILYDADKISLVSQGSYKYTAQVTNGMRHLAYAVLQVKSTGTKFLFTDTHLEVADATVREQEWQEAIDKVNELKGNLPVVSVGDYNIQKMSDAACRMLPLQKSSGVTDVLNQVCDKNPTTDIRAQHLINGWINSNNAMRRDVSAYSYSDRHDKTGNSIDWIFASNALAVPEYKLVLDYNPSTLQVNGVIPSDHNMVRATITLP